MRGDGTQSFDGNEDISSRVRKEEADIVGCGWHYMFWGQEKKVFVFGRFYLVSVMNEGRSLADNVMLERRGARI